MDHEIGVAAPHPQTLSEVKEGLRDLIHRAGFKTLKEIADLAEARGVNGASRSTISRNTSGKMDESEMSEDGVRVVVRLCNLRASGMLPAANEDVWAARFLSVKVDGGSSVVARSWTGNEMEATRAEIPAGPLATDHRLPGRVSAPAGVPSEPGRSRRRMMQVSAAAALLTATVVAVLIAWTAVTPTRPSVGAEAGPIVSGVASPGMRPASDAVPGEPKLDHRAAFGDKQCLAPAARPSSEGLAITAPVSGTTIGTPTGNDGLAMQMARGTATLRTGQHLWILLYAPGVCIFYLMSRDSVTVMNGAWAMELWLDPKEPGHYQLYAALVNDADNQRIIKAESMAYSENVNSPGLFRLPPGRAASIPVTCCTSQ